MVGRYLKSSANISKIIDLTNCFASKSSDTHSICTKEHTNRAKHTVSFATHNAQIDHLSQFSNHLLLIISIYSH